MSPRSVGYTECNAFITVLSSHEMKTLFKTQSMSSLKTAGFFIIDLSWRARGIFC